MWFKYTVFGNIESNVPILIQIQTLTLFGYVMIITNYFWLQESPVGLFRDLIYLAKKSGGIYTYNNGAPYQLWVA